ncbi:helix-turn-helix domain-containing protein [Clostridium botulinum]|uniref:helix-turn-helix domain-containing protein n=1 Tax=Clostridium botulinum TaxID=1491 RepID=UPI0019686168|nr:helix-turn-helix transcriptional regulator [Clostridium botulinum]MBN1057077.1 XRE family transcriptional regulator [Clostridium botulinum]
MIYEKLGNNIKLERLRLNLTQEQLSERLDISTSYLGRIERGERNVPLDTLIRLADILNVSIDYLLRDFIYKNNTDILNYEINQLISGLSHSEQSVILDMVRLMVSHFKNK